MLSLLSIAPGGPDTLVLEDMPAPAAGPGQVVVRVAACAVNYPDSLIIEDRYQYRPARPFAPGAEIAGVVEAVGEGVTSLAAGDRVMAMPGWGGMTERIALDASRCFRLPDAMPFEHGAALIMTYGTAYHALVQRAALKPGEVVLILGAAGGVGLAAIEVARALGATVIAAASSEAKLRVALDHGADRGLAYPRGPLDADARRALTERMKAATGGGGADVVVDCVGGDLTEAALRATAWDGRLLIVGFPAGIARLPANLLLLKGASAVGIFYGRFIDEEPEQDAANMRALLALYEAGRIRPHITERFSLAEGGRAITALLRPEAHGKIIVDVDPPEATA